MYRLKKCCANILFGNYKSGNKNFLFLNRKCCMCIYVNKNYLNGLNEISAK